jgi:hypothetical protein
MMLKTAFASALFLVGATMAHATPTNCTFEKLPRYSLSFTITGTKIEGTLTTKKNLTAPAGGDVDTTQKMQAQDLLIWSTDPSIDPNDEVYFFIALGTSKYKLYALESAAKAFREIKSGKAFCS